MAQLMGKNEGVDYIHKMSHQSSEGNIQYPSDTNMRGGAKAGGHRGENDVSRHAAGDMVKAQDNVMEAKKGGAMHHRHGRHHEMRKHCR